MQKLFILGNGFDLAHGLKTSYKDFNLYLKNEYPNAIEEYYTTPKVLVGSDGEDVFEDDEAVGLLIHLISLTEGSEWKDVEETLGIMDFGDCFWDDDWVDKNDDDGLLKHIHANEDVARNLIPVVSKINIYFADWVETIEIDDKAGRIEEFSKLINVGKDLFLTFNYTETLEKLYDVERVCHIHGKKGGKIIFGHGNDGKPPFDNDCPCLGTEFAISEIRSNLRKDSGYALKKTKISLTRSV